MSETLWGVIIGGAFGGGFSMVVLIVEHLRWNKEFKIRYLQAERTRREEQCKKIRNYFHEGEKSDKWDAYLEAEWLNRLPIKVRNRIIEITSDADRNQNDIHKEPKLYLLVSHILGEFLAEIDEEIDKLSR
mgnify:CR=1 FL=1